MCHCREVSLSGHTRVIFKKPEVNEIFSVFVLWSSTMRKIKAFSSPDRKLHHLIWKRFTATMSFFKQSDITVKLKFSYHLIFKIISHNWMRSHLGIVPVKMLYFILYNVVVFQNITDNNNFSSCIETHLLSC
jgi:hypothetical protein